MSQSKWFAKVTPENVATLVEFGARFQMNLDHLKDSMEFNAEDGVDTYLLMFNPESIRSVTFKDVPAHDFEGRYIGIPVYHPEGHFQQFEWNH